MHVILFDGECHFMNELFNLLLKDKALYRFPSLQSEAGQEILDNHYIPDKH